MSQSADVWHRPLIVSKIPPALSNTLSKLPATAWVIGATTTVLILGRKRLSRSLLYWFTKLTCRKRKGQAYLEGPFGPTRQELFQEDLKVEGHIPAELSGLYIRNGPNPFFDPVASYHWFDGDGMLHSCRIKDGKVSYCNRYVDTYKLKQERAAGWPVFHKFGDLEGIRGLVIVLLDLLLTKLGAIRKEKPGSQTGNTALVFAAKKLLALNEGDLPYQIRMLCNGLIESSRRLVLNNWEREFTAHPKLDPVTGQLHFFGYSTSIAPYVTYGVMNTKGEVVKTVPITIPEPVMMHDFAITEHYAIFMDLPLLFHPKSMVEKNTLPLIFDKNRVSRFGLLPLDADSEASIRWFELPACMIFHVFNACEMPNGQIKLFASYFNSINLASDGENMSTEEMPFLTEISFDLSSGKATTRRMSEINVDFPVVNPNYTGRVCQYSWAANWSTSCPPGSFAGIAKMKMDTPEGTDACLGRILYEPGWVGGEAIFVPRHEDPAKCAGEDDGFLLVYITHVSGTLPSKMLVFDAATMAQQPLATVALPQRVPMGFHGLFVNETQLQSSIKAA